MPSDVRRSCLDCQADIQLFRLSLTIAVYKTKPIAIGKEVYALKYDFSWFFQEKITADASKMV